ncbi:ABC transporter ATP-binding protein [Streptomyces pactum]|uniref:ABC transporter ATP-binding protein n=1 Tax=Streptomyces pactum TaxID=68249 RepID=A0ABS0NHL1_9ACTN|nr:ABC transporter ATP-binding protein [Streptomyces pactum]MBH5334594.1 ABC transporter ATP-binding protein [Streptomyces pactum]
MDDLLDEEGPGPAGRRLRAEGARFLRRRRAVLLRLAGWSLLETAQTFLTGYALARAVDDGFLAGRVGTGLAWLGAAAVAVLAGAFGAGRVLRAVAALVEALRDGLVRRVVRGAVTDAVRAGTPDRGHAAVSRLTHQVEIARDTAAGLVLVSRSFVFVAIGALAGLATLAPVLLLIVVPPLLLGLAVFLLTLRPMARHQETWLLADEEVARELGDLATGLRDITAAGAEDQLAAGTGRRIDAEYRAARVLARWSVLRVLAVGIGGRLPVVLLLAASPWLLRSGVTAGALVGALGYLHTSLLPALQSLMHALGTGGSRFAVVLRRLTAAAPRPEAPAAPRPTAPGHSAPSHPTGSVSAASSEPAAPPGPPPSGPAAPGPSVSGPASGAFPVVPPPAVPPTTAAAVELRSVSFAYGAAAVPVLDGMDLTVPVGGHLAVLGPSGVGKSTLAALIAGTLRPHAGEIRIDGVPVVPGRDAAALAGRRVLIPQEAYVFTGSLADNLTYLRPGAVPDAELDAVVGALGLEELRERAGGLHGTVRPEELSAAERQLVACARAFLSPAPLALLDEATCHLDAAAEARVERAFARRPGGTLVVVAHRAASARRAQRILVMDGPRTVSGTHPELLERSPLYRELVCPDGPEGAQWRPGADLPDGAARR